MKRRNLQESTISSHSALVYSAQRHKDAFAPVHLPRELDRRAEIGSLEFRGGFSGPRCAVLLHGLSHAPRNSSGPAHMSADGPLCIISRRNGPTGEHSADTGVQLTIPISTHATDPRDAYILPIPMPSKASLF